MYVATDRILQHDSSYVATYIGHCLSDRILQHDSSYVATYIGHCLSDRILQHAIMLKNSVTGNTVFM
jgi:lipid A disaccharide synthetase